MTAPRLAVCLVVTDDGRDLHGCLQSLRQLGPLLGQTCVYGAGVAEQALEAARRAGAVVEAGEWDGDAAGVRNRAACMTDATWVLCLESDERLRVDADRRIGDEGQGMAIALSALDSGRLGIAAGATGLAQGALDVAAAYAKEREQFGRPIAANQGLAFLLADMEAAITSARATYLHAARLRDAGRAFSKEAAVAKLVCTDAAMQVTTDAVQVLGGAGYTQDFPVERYMREAKVAQIFEGTNQIQRLVISRHVLA